VLIMLGRVILRVIENGTGVATLTSPNRSLTRPSISRSAAFMDYRIPVPIVSLGTFRIARLAVC